MSKEKLHNREPSIEDYEKLLEIKLIDITASDLMKKGWFRFLVNSNFTIYITSKTHKFIVEQYGVDWDEITLEGDIEIKKDLSIDLNLKYGKGSNLEEAVKRKVLHLVSRDARAKI